MGEASTVGGAQQKRAARAACGDPLRHRLREIERRDWEVIAHATRRPQPLALATLRRPTRSEPSSFADTGQ